VPATAVRHELGAKHNAIAPGLRGPRHSPRSCTLMGTFGRVEINISRARLRAAGGKASEWKSRTLPAYQRRRVL